jgi:hypothetical protein
MPMTLSPSTPPTKQHQVNPSPFEEVSHYIKADRFPLMPTTANKDRKQI